MKKILTILLLAVPIAVSGKTLEYTTSALDDDANGVAEDQTLGGAGNLTLNGVICDASSATNCVLSEAQILSFESTGNLSGVTFTVNCQDADGNAYSESLAGPNNSTVTTSGYCKTIQSIAADGAVGTNVEVGPLATNGAVTPTLISSSDKAPSYTITVEKTAGAPTGYGVQYTNSKVVDNDSFWEDAVDSSGNGPDPDTNTTDGSHNIYSKVGGIRGKIVGADTSTIVTFTFRQASR